MKWMQIYNDFCKSKLEEFIISTPRTSTLEIIWMLSEWEWTEEDMLCIILKEILDNFDIPKLKIVNGNLLRIEDKETPYFQ